MVVPVADNLPQHNPILADGGGVLTQQNTIPINEADTLGSNGATTATSSKKLVKHTYGKSVECDPIVQ